jgi:hypothetical protein
MPGPVRSTSAKLRLATSRAQISELKGAELAGSLVKVTDVADIVAAEYSRCRERLIGIPGKISTDLVGCSAKVIEARLRDEIYEALNELKEPSDTPIVNPRAHAVGCLLGSGGSAG